MMTARRRGVFVIVDGLGDRPVERLGQRTPLEAAATPVLDQLLATGDYGLVDPTRPGEVPNTHSGTGILLGVPPEQVDRMARGPVEACGAGRQLVDGEVALRANFATLTQRNGRVIVTDRRAGRIRRGTNRLAAELQDIDLGDGISGSLQPTDQHRGVVVLSGPGLDPSISDTDPGDGTLPAELQPCEGLRPQAAFTAEKVNAFINEAQRRLEGHPVNRERAAAGQSSASGVITRGAGSSYVPDNIVRDSGLCAVVIAGCNTVRGLAAMAGFDTVTEPAFTAGTDTDLDAKVRATLAALDEYDLAYLHVKAADICAHDRQPLAKRDFLERLDRALEPLLGAGVVVAVAADHTTDSNTGVHTADPVPALISVPGHARGQGVRTVSFGERSCATGTLPRQSGHRFLLSLVDALTA